MALGDYHPDISTVLTGSDAVSSCCRAMRQIPWLSHRL
jgi:hypothetical protein